MKIILLDQITIGNDLDYSGLQELGDVLLNQSCTEDEMRKLSVSADILIGNKVQFNEKTLSQAENLKLICLTSTGYNNCDLDYLKKRGIGLCNIPSYSTDSVAQHTFAMLFHYMEKLDRYHEHVRRRDFVGKDVYSLAPTHFHELSGKTWGIIGMGNIGRKVADIASAFGCRVIYYSSSDTDRSEKYSRVSLDELLSRSYILSIHAPLTEKTRDLLTMKELRKMKREACIINVGRGGIANESDLAEALKNEIISGACIDVYSEEPIREDSPYLQIADHPGLVLTPHIAWAAVESRQRAIDLTAANIRSFLKGEKQNRIL